MKRVSLFLILLFAAAAFALVMPGTSEAQGEERVATTVIGEGTFITVKDSAAGEVLSLYRIKGDRIILLDTVVNTSSRSDRDIRLSDRYLHRLKVENR